MKRCHWKKRLSAYLDGELSGEARRRVEQHLAECAECAQTAAEWQTVYEQLAAPAPQLLPFFETRLQARLTAQRHGAVNRLHRLLVPAAVCCGLLVGAVLGVELNLALTDPRLQTDDAGYVDVGFLDVIPHGSLTEAFINLTEQMRKP